MLAGFELVTVWKAERGPSDSNKLLPVLVWHRRAVLEHLIRIMQFSFCRIESRDEGSSLVGHQSPGFFLVSPPLTTFQTYTRMNGVGKEVKDTKRGSLDANSKPCCLDTACFSSAVWWLAFRTLCMGKQGLTLQPSESVFFHRTVPF